MDLRRKLLLSLFSLCYLATIIRAQDYVIIDTILIEGNVRTKDEVIFRELDIKIKDTLSLEDLSKRMLLNEKRLLSIGLFTWADINIRQWDIESRRATMNIVLRENWFIYPYIIFDLADRNFDVWRKEFNYALDRVNYGLGLKHLNLTGMKDFLQLKFQTGYTQKYEIKYEYPYLSNGWGFNIGFLYKANKEINYKTIGNKPAFFKAEDERVLLRHWIVSGGLYNRANALLFHQVQLDLNFAGTDRMISEGLNAEYFGAGRNHLNFPSLSYSIRYDRRLYPLYPMGGPAVWAEFRKDGLPGSREIDLTTISVSLENTFRFTRFLFLTSEAGFKWTASGRHRVPYFLNRAVGYYPDVLTGYQLFVSDGSDFYIQKNALKCKLFERNFTTSSLLPKQFRLMNTKVFLRTNFDFAYVHDPNFAAGNSFVNRWIYGYGPALDMIFYNFVTLSLSYGVTMDRQRGFYFYSDFNF
jgi:outer membrane protein assembly factor BamA